MSRQARSDRATRFFAPVLMIVAILSFGVMAQDSEEVSPSTDETAMPAESQTGTETGTSTEASPGGPPPEETFPTESAPIPNLDGESVGDGLLPEGVASEGQEVASGVEMVPDPGRDDGLVCMMPATAAERIISLGKDWDRLMKKLDLDSVLELHKEADKVRVSVGVPEFDAEASIEFVRQLVENYETAKEQNDSAAMESALNDIINARGGESGLDPDLLAKMRKEVQGCKERYPPGDSSPTATTPNGENYPPTEASTNAGAPTGKTPPGAGDPREVQATGYFPPPPEGYASEEEAQMEGGANDRNGNPLRTLQDYDPDDPDDYVSCATDPREFPTGTFFTLDQFPGVRFLACDVGDMIKGDHIDICCKTEADCYKLPSTVTLRTIE